MRNPMGWGLQKPPLGTQLIEAEARRQLLHVAVAVNEGYGGALINSADSDQKTFSNAINVTWSTGFFGPHPVFTTGCSWNANNKQNRLGTTGQSSPFSVAGIYLFSEVITTQTTLSDFGTNQGFKVVITGSTIKAQIGTGAATNSTGTLSISANKYYAIQLTYDQSALTLMLYDIFANSYTTAAVTSAYQAVGGAATLVYGNVNGGFITGAFWGRSRDKSEMVKWARNPFDVWQPARRPGFDIPMATSPLPPSGRIVYAPFPYQLGL